MRKVGPFLFVGLGAFLLAAAVIALTWVPGVVERTPLDTADTTVLAGTASTPNDEFVLEEGPVKAYSQNDVDSDKSDDDVAVFVTSLCLVHDVDGIDGCVDENDPQGRLISAEQAMFAVDRHTGMTVDNDGYLPEGSPQYDGLQNKFPFNAEKTTYPVWDDIVGAAVDAEYQGEDEIDGLDVYVYEYTTNVGPVNLVADIEGTYYATYTYYVEPKTGKIINQVVHQERIASGVETILELDLQFTDEQIQANVDDVNDSLSLLRTLEVIVPIVGLVGGVLVLAAGLLLLVRGRRRTEEREVDRAAKEPAGV
jgi:hypothetical protein